MRSVVGGIVVYMKGETDRGFYIEAGIFLDVLFFSCT